MVAVLVVDDERKLLALVEGYRHTECFAVATAMRGPSAVDRPSNLA